MMGQAGVFTFHHLVFQELGKEAVPPILKD